MSNPTNGTDAAAAALKGTAFSFVAGAAAGAAYASLRTPQSLISTSVQISFNAGLFGLVFFHIREFVFSPLLHRPLQYGSYRDIRMRRVPESALAGATAAVINVALARRGRVSLNTLGVSGFAGGVLCPLVQLAANETRVMRVRLSGGVPEGSVEAPPPATSEDKLEKWKERLGILNPMQRTAREDARELERLRKEKEASDARLEEVRRRIQEAEREQKR